MRTNTTRRRTAALVAALLTTILATLPAQADPFHAPVVDGSIAPDGVDWVVADRVLSDEQDYAPLDNGDFYRLYVTWTADSLYVGANWLASNRTGYILLDLDRDSGLVSAADLDTLPVDATFTGGRTIDLVIARAHGLFNDPGTPGVFLVQDADGTTLDVTAQTSGAQGFVAAPPSRLPAWYHTEVAIPWSLIHPDGPPAFATLDAVGVIKNTAGGIDGEDVAPDNPGEGAAGPITVEAMHTSILDPDGDGDLDPLDASVSGRVILPDNPGGITATISAELIDWAGGDLADPVSTAASSAADETYRLGRLPGGTYDVTYAADGYFPATERIVLTAGQTLTGRDVTLDRATTITGTLSLELGQYLGGYRFRRPDGTLVRARSLLPSQFPHAFTFYVSQSGTYTLEAYATNHLTTTFELVVTAGEDLLDQAFTVPRASLIAGAVSFNTGPGGAGTVSLGNAAGDTVFATVAVDAADPSFTFYAPRLGDLVLTGSAETYLDGSLPVVAEASVDLTGLDLPLARRPELRGALSFGDGPGAAGEVLVTLEGDEEPSYVLEFGAAGGDAVFFVAEGVYEVLIDAPGYGLWSDTLTLSGGDTVTDLGEIVLLAARADRLRLLDAEGEPVESLSATVSIPADDFYAYAALTVEAVDADGRRDLFDLDAKLDALPLTARKLDDVAPPRGFARFLGSEDVEDVIATVDVVDGLAAFYLANDAIEVLRIFVGPEVPDPLKQGPEPPTGRFMVGFNDPRPATVVLSAARDTLRADGTDALSVVAELYDSAGNRSEIDGIPVTFSVSPSSSGRGAFTVPVVETNSTGTATAELTATGAGELRVDCAVSVSNALLEVRLGDLDGGAPPLLLTVEPGATERWRLSLPAAVAGLGAPVTVTGQLVDFYGNPTPRAGETLTLFADPPGLGAFDDPSPVSDAAGRVRAAFTPSGTAGLVAFTGSSALYPVDEALLQLRDVTVVSDPPWDQEPETANTFPPTDLTLAVVTNTPDALVIDVPLASDWNGLQIHVLLETKWDADGGSADAFQMPVSFAHEHRPDFLLTTKYSADDYGDFRAWNGGWEFWDLDAGEFSPDDTVNKNIQGLWTTKTAEGMHLEIPLEALGAATPDSLRLEVYLTQEDGVKRSAFDSVPSDATLDLDFDYENPGENDWDVALGPVSLREWSPAYRVRTDFPTPPTVTNAAADPASLEAGAPFTLTARVTDAGDGVGDVVADLSAIAGGAFVRMHDDGLPAHGDQTAGDGVWSLRSMVPPGSPGGPRDLVVAAYDGTNLLAGRDTAQVDVAAQVDLIVSVVDPAGDDHGPNRPGVEGLFYTYPTNSVFVPGAFDLLSLNVYETVAVVSGQSVDMIAFEVGLGDFPDPADPHTADWNPLYGDLNITKIDLLIDSAPGGATRSLPNRRVDVEAWNAWDYAIIMDGWYKALIPSLGQNTVDSWRENALLTDAEIQIVGDFERDTVTALVARSALGNPTADDIRNWNMAVMVSSHDFGGEEVLGGIRWVNESRSEWNFGGGHYTDRDPNVMDLVLVPGVGRAPGEPQEVVLDYESDRAVARLDAGETPCVLSMSEFEDTGPPVIHIPRDFGEVILREPLAGAPLAFTLEITDDFRVDSARFRYRSTTHAGEGWSVETDMGFIGNDLWSVDISDEWMSANLVYSPVDSMRYIEFQVEADDASDPPKRTVSPVTTVQVKPARESLHVSSLLGSGGTTLRHVDGSSLTVGEDLAGRLLDLWLDETGADVTVDSLATYLELGWEIATVEPMISSAPTVPRATPLGVWRRVGLDARDDATVLPLEGRLPAPLTLGLHYTDGHVPAGRPENRIGLFEYHPGSDRWVLSGGHVNERANTVLGTVDHAGIYGLFWAEDLRHDTGEVISGITVSPNPFSPNGDGLYDRATLGFYLTQEATVTVEIYNIEGRLKRRLQETFPYSGVDAASRAPQRVEGLIWDGTDSNGSYVPYGIYILRLIVTYNQAGGQRTIRSNHAVAVIR